jgi:dihydrofolate reductase
MKCSIFIACSVDGYIARPDGDIEWLHLPAYAQHQPPGLGYEQFISTIDAIVMGRATFEKVQTFGFWPYEGTPVFVLSRTQNQVPAGLEGKAEMANWTPQAVLAELERRGYRHLYIDGGVTAHGFLEAGLVTDLVITRIPVLLGDGIRLFHPGRREQHLRMVGVDAAENGFVQERYEVVAPGVDG